MSCTPPMQALAWSCLSGRWSAALEPSCALQRDSAAIKIQAAVRGHLTRSSFRKATELGRRQAARTALNARRSSAAVTIQKHVRRRIASKKVAHFISPHAMGTSISNIY